MTLQIAPAPARTDIRNDKWPVTASPARLDKWPVRTATARLDKWPLTA
jgi:hypothetical protein